jgi:hypothetical protein
MLVRRKRDDGINARAHALACAQQHVHILQRVLGLAPKNKHECERTFIIRALSGVLPLSSNHKYAPVFIINVKLQVLHTNH